MDSAPPLMQARGQVAAELVAVVPVLLVLALALAQLAIAGYSLWSAEGAARAGARAALVDGDVERAARSALPRWLGDDAKIDEADPVEVEVEAPALLPGVPSLPLSAEASLDPEAPDGSG